MSCVFLIFSVVKNVSCHYNVCSGETNFFIDSKRGHFIERSHYDDERIPYYKRFLEPIPLLFWYLIGIGCVYGEHVKISSTSLFMSTHEPILNSKWKSTTENDMRGNKNGLSRG